MSKVSRRIDQVNSKLNQKELLEFAHGVFVKLTPVDTGNARKSTVTQGTDTIFADYAYAKRLDQGWSGQARDGMSKPMFQEIRKYLKGI
jgi:hypothetical protein